MARSNGTATTEGTEQAAKEKDFGVISLRVPKDFHARVLGDATAKDTSVGNFVRDLLAQHYGVTLPKPTRGGRRQKYASKEERIAANKARQAQNREKLKALLALYEQDPDAIQRMLSEKGINMATAPAPAEATA